MKIVVTAFCALAVCAGPASAMAPEESPQGWWAPTQKECREPGATGVFEVRLTSGSGRAALGDGGHCRIDRLSHTAIGYRLHMQCFASAEDEKAERGASARQMLVEAIGPVTMRADGRRVYRCASRPPLAAPADPNEAARPIAAPASAANAPLDETPMRLAALPAVSTEADSHLPTTPRLDLVQPATLGQKEVASRPASEPSREEPLGATVAVAALPADEPKGASEAVMPPVLGQPGPTVSIEPSLDGPPPSLSPEAPVPALPANALAPASPILRPVKRGSLVSFSGGQQPGTIVVRTQERALYLVQEGGKAIRYRVAVGKPGFSWTGIETVSAKQMWPGWTPPPAMRRRRPGLPLFMRGGPGNPLGARAIYLGKSEYRIHGTTEPGSIGRAASSGCFRMHNKDVMELYERVPVGTRVVVL